MAFPWGIVVALLGGIAYGYLSRGATVLAEFRSWGLAAALTVGLVLASVGYAFALSPLGLEATSIYTYLAAIVALAATFVVGEWVGDVLETRSGRSPTRDDRRT